MSNKLKIPTMQELIEETPESLAQNALTIILNQEPPKEWLSNHPMIANYKYLAIERVEYLLTRIFGKWWVEVKTVQTVANSVVVTVRLFVTNPITGETQWNDGIGAAPIQTDKGAGATDWNSVKTDGVQKAAPSAESYAIKDAAEKFGKIFGKDVSRKNQINYNDLLKSDTNDDTTPTKEELNPEHPSWVKAKESVKGGKFSLERILDKYFITSENLALFNA